MRKTKLVIPIVILVLATSQLIRAQSSQVTVAGEDILGSKFVIGPWAIRIPRGAFLLIRKGREVAAVRFTSFEFGTEPNTGKATYESFSRDDGSGSFLAGKVIKHSGEVHIRHVRGVRAVPITWSQRKVRIGKWSFGSNVPGLLDMYPYGREPKDRGFEFAPTSAQELGEIDVSDKRLKWFRFSNDKSITLSLSELSK